MPLTARQFQTGKNADIDNAAEALSTSSIGCTNGVLVKADAANAGTVYVGPEGVAEADGYPLAAGEEVFVPVDDVAKVYVIASEADQAAAWMAT